MRRCGGWSQDVLAWRACNFTFTSRHCLFLSVRDHIGHGARTSDKNSLFKLLLALAELEICPVDGAGFLSLLANGFSNRRERTGRAKAKRPSVQRERERAHTHDNTQHCPPIAQRA